MRKRKMCLNFLNFANSKSKYKEKTFSYIKKKYIYMKLNLILKLCLRLKNNATEHVTGTYKTEK